MTYLPRMILAPREWYFVVSMGHFDQDQYLRPVALTMPLC